MAVAPLASLPTFTPIEASLFLTLSGRALVAGASSGIGIALALARVGATLATLAPLLPGWSSWPALAVGAVVLWAVGTWLGLTLAVAALYAWLALALVGAVRPAPGRRAAGRRRPARKASWPGGPLAQPETRKQAIGIADGWIHEGTGGPPGMRRSKAVTAS